MVLTHCMPWLEVRDIQLMLRYADGLHVLQTGKEDFAELNDNAGRGASRRQKHGSKSQQTYTVRHLLAGSSQGAAPQGESHAAQRAAEDVFKVNCVAFCADQESMSFQLVVPTASMPSKEEVDQMKDPYQQRANYDAVAKADGKSLLVLAESIVKLSWLIDNNQCTVVIPLATDLDVSLGDMQDLGRRPSASARSSPGSRSAKENGLGDAITIGKLQFTVQFTKNRLYPPLETSQVYQEADAHENNLEQIYSSLPDFGEIDGSQNLTAGRIQTELNRSMFQRQQTWVRPAGPSQVKPRLESVQDESFKQNCSQRTVINRYQAARTARRNSAAKSSRDRHRFSFDFMGRKDGSNNQQMQADTDYSSPMYEHQQ